MSARIFLFFVLLNPDLFDLELGSALTLSCLLFQVEEGNIEYKVKSAHANICTDIHQICDPGAQNHS